MVMQKIPLAMGNRKRLSTKEPIVALKNRFVEANPVLGDNGPAFIQRPAISFWAAIGNGPIRALAQQPGAFNDDAFAVSYDQLWRLDRTSNTGAGNEVIYTGLAGADENAAVPMDFTGDIGEITPRLFFADGNALTMFTENGFATATLNVTSVADGDVVQIGGVYYRMSSGTLDSGAPAGTAGNPWRVLSTGTTIQAVDRLFHAINNTGEPGVDYSTALIDANPEAFATFSSATQLRIRAIEQGVLGNAVSTTETGANMSWGGATTTGGGTPGTIPIPTPEGVGVIDVVSLNNFLFVIPAQGEGLNGRFYWIEPGELTIDPLNYATAERSADPVNSVRVFGDQFWLMGQNSTEPWYMTGDVDFPVARLQGVVFDRGVHQGTAIQVKGSIILVDSFGGVFQIENGEKRISTPDIEEVLRKAIARQYALS